MEHNLILAKCSQKSNLSACMTAKTTEIEHELSSQKNNSKNIAEIRHSLLSCNNDRKSYQKNIMIIDILDYDSFVYCYTILSYILVTSKYKDCKTWLTKLKVCSIFSIGLIFDSSNKGFKTLY